MSGADVARDTERRWRHREGERIGRCCNMSDIGYAPGAEPVGDMVGRDAGQCNNQPTRGHDKPGER
jgi:hypothetical protein